MGDLIERSVALRKFIEGDGDDKFTEGYNFAVEEYSREIAEIPAVNRWIPVSERMPDDELPVIVAHIDSEGYGLPSIGMFRGNPKKWVTSSAIRIMNVTHWMPIPDAPEVKNNEI